MNEKYYYLVKNLDNQDYHFEECELVLEKSTKYKRVVKMLEGEKVDQEVEVHPEGVAWGKLYPRLVKAEQKPTSFVFKGRSLVRHEEPNALIPKKNHSYRFQPFMASVIDSINAKENVLLTGGTGVGKTSSIEQLAAECRIPLIRVNMNAETRLSDFIGKTHVIDHQTVWKDGVLPMAMKHGYWLLLDELDFADPAILSLLHPVLEENAYLVLKENGGEVIRPHENFRVFATANSIGAMSEKAGDYAGTNHMNEAFLDRWQVLLIPNLSEKEELKVVKERILGIKSSWAKGIVSFAQKVRSRSLDRNMDLPSNSFSTRRVLAWAKKTALLNDPIAGAKLSFLDKMPESDHDPLLKVLELYFKRSKKKKNNNPKAPNPKKETTTSTTEAKV